MILLVFVMVLLGINLSFANEGRNESILKDGISAFDYFQSTEHEEKRNISLVKVDNIWATKYAYTWETSLEELNSSESALAFEDDFYQLCRLYSTACFISLKEEKGYYLEMNQLHRQLNGDYVVKQDAHREKKSDYVSVSYSSKKEQFALLQELHDSGFVIENYGYYPLKKDKTNVVKLIIDEDTLDETEYGLLMNVLKKHIADYELKLHLKDEGSALFSKDIIEYKELVKEVESF